ncbi:cytochrome P450 [Mycena floridula]|nr:cytochrome P450 [Mycena floridula]
MASAAIILLLASILTFLWIQRSRKSPSKTTGPLPPGPKPVPVLGNVKDLTAKELWLKATEWSKQYGDVTHLHILGQSLIFLSSPTSTLDLLDKRSSLYSDKPSLVMAGDLCGCSNMVAFTPYGPQSKRQRRLINSAFSTSAIPAYQPLIVTQTNRFLAGVVKTPEAVRDLTRMYAGGLTLSVVYGYDAKTASDPFFALAEECVGLLANRIASGGGLWPVDIFPILKHYPEWLPGGSFKKNAKVWKAKMEEFVDKPWGFVRDSVKQGTFYESFCSKLVEEHANKETEMEGETEFDIKWTANSMYSASIDTTITAVSHFLLAMMSHPEALARAQAEIDAVVGTDRLPTFSDRPHLVYCEALLLEVYRWGVPVPLNLPHRLSADDTYRGMHMPKGALVFGNIWAICRDPNMYPDPDSFIPERFLEEVTTEEIGEEKKAAERRRDPRSYVFGFGRRRCPGANLVDSTNWLLIVSMIATLNISRPKDVNGKERRVDEEVRFENSVFRIPTEFDCDLRPRSARVVEMMRDMEEEMA